MTTTVPGAASEYRRHLRKAQLRWCGNVKPAGKNVKREMLTPKNHYRTLGHILSKVGANR
ncbi:MAG TPA: hypothetical protein VGM75_15350 [Pseudonocardiaceae bacterium]|jgi:hypothetical protein